MKRLRTVALTQRVRLQRHKQYSKNEEEEERSREEEEVEEEEENLSANNFELTSGPVARISEVGKAFFQRRTCRRFNPPRKNSGGGEGNAAKVGYGEGGVGRGDTGASQSTESDDGVRRLSDSADGKKRR